MSEYTEVQKWFTALVVIPCTAVCVLFYKYAKRRLPGKTETQARRMEKWNAILAGATMGQFFCHTLRKGLIDTGIVTASRDIWGYNILIGFVLLSFFVLLCIDKYSLVWNDNPFHTVDGIYMSGAENLLDRDHVEETRYHESNDVTSEAYAVESFSRMDSKRIVQIKRRRAILLFFIMLVLVVIEGAYLVYRQHAAWGGPATLVAMYWIDKIMETVVLCAALIDGNVHAWEDGKHRYFWVMGCIWCVAVLLSTMPVLLAKSTAHIATWVEFWLTGIVHAIAGGMLFYVSIYFTFLDRPGTDKRDMCARIFLWLGACVIAYVTGIFV